MKRSVRTFGLAALILCTGVTEARAQSADHPEAFVRSPQALGMGDAGVAFSAPHTVFFHNPAHVAPVASTRPRITIAGVRASLSENVFEQISFFKETLEPALDEGLEAKTGEELDELYDRTLALGRRTALATGDVLLPSILLKAGAAAFGAGIFGHSTVRYRFEDAGAGIPRIDFGATADLVVAGIAGVDLAGHVMKGLSAGTTVKITQRWISVKKKSLDDFADDEDIYLLRGTSLGLDLGILFRVPTPYFPGEVAIGLAGYDVAVSDFDYRFGSNLTKNGIAESPQIDEEIDLANAAYDTRPSFRIGTAYRLSLPTLPVDDVGFALDYFWRADSGRERVFLAGLHAGVQARLSVLVLRLGLNAGYTAVGLGIDAGFITLDYAYYGVEEGRFPGQLASWNHAAQIAVVF